MSHRVYVSSTFTDLRQHREAVIAALRRMKLDVVAMEDYTAENLIPVDRCLEDVAGSHIYVGLFAWRYGFVPTGHERSITELELRKAQERGIPTLIFVLDEDHPWPSRFIDDDRKAVRQLRQELCERLMADFFTTPADLAVKMATAIPKEIDKLRVQNVQATAFAEPAAYEAVQTMADRAIRPYLSWLVETHENLDLRGLHHAEGGSVQVPLEKVYVALKADRTNPQERAEARRAMEEELLAAIEAGQFTLEDAQSARWYVVAGSPVMPSLKSRDRTGEPAELLTLGDAYRRERRLVILGDPGSGKTTIARWLCLVMAKAMLAGNDRVEVPTSQVDPEAFNDNFPFLLGSPRLPVLVRVSEFAAERRERRDSWARCPSLTEYLGHHSWMNSRPTWDAESSAHVGEAIQPEVVNDLIRSHLEKGQALIVLDGLDEIPASSQRDELVEEVDAFVRRWVRPRYQVAMKKLGHESVATIRAESALTEGGNQLIVTSRIAGYHAAPLRGDLAHVTVEPMSMAAIDHFTNTWMHAVHDRLRKPGDTDEQVAERAAAEALALRLQVHEPRRRGVRELATNPLLASVLATVFHERNRRLPEQRVELYRIAVANLIGVWHRRSAPGDEPSLLEGEIFDVLEPVAAHIHQHEPTGLIPENQLCELATRFLAESRGENPLRPTAQLRKSVAALLKAVREDVGLLAARGEGVYGCLHLTFQEYLAARWLVRDPELAVRRLMGRLDDPRWREPILMALGYANTTFPSRFPELVEAVLSYDGEVSSLFPQSALMMAAALPELAQVSAELVIQIGDHLLLAYEGDGSPDHLPRMREMIELAFRRLLDGGHERPIEECLRRALAAGPNRPVRPSAAAALLRKIDWITPHLAAALIAALPADTGEWGWPVCAALRDAVTPTIGEVPRYPHKPTVDPRLARLETELAETDDPALQGELKMRITSLTEHAEAAQENYQRQKDEFERLTAQIASTEGTLRLQLPLTDLPFRYALEREPGLVQRITSSPGWYRLVVALYGGFVDLQTPATIREYQQIAAYLQLEDNERSPFEVFYREEWGSDDAVYAMAVFLDERSRLFKSQWCRKPEFRTSAIYRDSHFTSPIIRALREGKPAESLVPLFEEARSKGAGPALQGEAILALISLGCEMSEQLGEATDGARMALRRIAQLRASLADPVVRASQHVVPLLREVAAEAAPVDWVTWFEALLTTALENGSPPLNVLPLLSVCQERFKAQVLAEQMAHRFSGWGDDSVFEAGHLISTVGSGPGLVCDALRLVSATRHINWPYYAYEWQLEQLPPATVRDGDVPTCVLSAIEQLPSQLSHLRESLLGTVIRKLLPRSRELLPELLAVTLADVGDRSDRDRTLAELAPELIDRPDAPKCVLTQARLLDSPYHRARAVWRLARHFPELRLELLREAEAAADDVLDAHERLQVLERLAASTHDRASLLEKCRLAAGAIDDPANKCRAWGRLSFLHPAAEAREFLRRALDAAREVPDECERAENFRLLRGAIKAYPDLTGELRVACEALGNPLARARGLGRFGRVLIGPFPLSVDDADVNPILVPLTLAALLADAGARQPEPTVDGLLHRLAVAPTEANRDMVIQALGGNPFPLSGVSAQSLDHVLMSNNPAVAFPLLPMFDRAHPEAAVTVQKWLRDTRPEVAGPAALLLAEQRGMCRETIPALVDFMRDDEDLLRHRAARVIHRGKLVENGFPLRVSLLGQEVIEMLSKASLDTSYEHPGVAVALRWNSHILLHDDPMAIGHWAKAIAAGGTKAKVSATCLSSAEAVTPQVWQALLQTLRVGSAAARSAALTAIARLKHLKIGKSDRISQEQWQQFLELVPVIEKEGLEYIKFLPATHRQFISVIEAVATVGEDNGGRGLVAQMRSLIWDRHSISYSDILSGDPVAIAEHFNNICATLHYVTKIPTVRTAAEKIRDNPELFPLLLRWLEVVLDEGVRDPEDPFTNERCTLLELTAAAAHHSPATFARFADPDQYEPLLYLVIRYHNSYPGRAAAVRLLGYLRRISPRVVDALHYATRDVTQVQEAVMDAASLFRKLDGTFIERLVEGLDSPSAMAAYSTAHILSAIGRSERTSPEQRRQILSSLASAISRPASRRTVHFWYVDACVPGQPRLADTFYSAMLKVAGMA
jgi:hypothetical protein